MPIHHAFDTPRICRKAVCAFLIAVALYACAPTDHHIIMLNLRAQFAQQGCECVPLGWVPVRLADTYYQGYSAELDQTDWWLPPKWVGRVSTKDLKHANVRVTYDLLNELTRVGMLDRKPAADAFEYHLTLSALPFYYDEDALGNNPEHFTYLCYSRMVPERLTWSEPIHLEQIGDAPEKMEAFRAAFEWRPSPAAAWAENAFLRSHSVVLAPSQHTLTVKFVNWKGTWEIYHVNMFASALPHIGVTDASVWPASRL